MYPFYGNETAYGRYRRRYAASLTVFCILQYYGNYETYNNGACNKQREINWVLPYGGIDIACECHNVRRGYLEQENKNACNNSRYGREYKAGKKNAFYIRSSFLCHIMFHFDVIGIAVQ